MFLEEALTVSGLLVFEADFQKKQRIHVPARPFHSLTFRYSGAITVETERHSLLSGADTVTYVPAGQAYATEILENGHMTVIHFDVLQNTPSAVPAVLTPKNAPALHLLFSALADQFAGRSSDYMCLSRFYEILGTLQREAMTANVPESSRRITAAKHWIDKNYGSAGLSVKELASRAGVSEVYFRREFRLQLGIAPLAYIRNVRLENAKSFLRTGYYTVTETAEKCGFDSLSYFCSEFHRFAGLTPGEYLKKYNSG